MISHKFKVIIPYVASWSPFWASGDPVKKQQTSNNSKKKQTKTKQQQQNNKNNKITE